MRHRLGIENRVTLVSLLAIVLIVLGSCILLDRPLVRGDGLAYFMWLDSLACDADLDLANQATKFAHVNTYHAFVYEKNGALCLCLSLWQCFAVGAFLLVGYVSRQTPVSTYS